MRPCATYRIQLHPGFTFDDAREIVGYLADLGISTVYLSPIFTPCHGSPHGYDVCDPSIVNPELGGEEALGRLIEEIQAHDLDVLLDFVPNHMAASPENPWWRDVLQHGRGSSYASFFDIDWDPPWPGSEGKIMVPILGDHYADVLERGELSVVRSQDEWVLKYWEHELPLDPKTWDEAASEPTGDALDALLDKQHYRLSHWKIAPHEINYRRFFNINDLIGVCMENPAVREAMHAKLFELLERGWVQGIRLDHVDGLREPRGYLAWLREEVAARSDEEPYLVVEKILAHGEWLPEDWPVEGTTGYDYLNFANGLFVDPEGLRRLDRVYGDITGRTQSFADVVYQKRIFVIDWLFRAEIERLRRELTLLARKDRRGRDIAANHLADAIGEISACLPVYRTYIRDANVSEVDRDYIDGAVEAARARTRTIPDYVFDYVRKVLLLEVPDALRDDALRFVLAWQQFTPPVMAKGLEDTSLYVFNRLISLNDVGGEPDEGETTIADFHRFNRARLEHTPHALSASSTHDSKRGEDVRARINVLSEIPEEWESHLRRWIAINERHVSVVDGERCPSFNEEIFLYQTLLGAWPLEEDGEFEQRLHDYVIKSMREAKESSSWHEPDARREEALVNFASAIISEQNHDFLEDFRPVQQRVAFFGVINSLSELLLKLTAPGVPDIYRGTESWALTLVDPDNRRPVDYPVMREKLTSVAGVEDPSSLLGTWPDGRIKMFVGSRVLQFRREHCEIFREGDYTPIYADGEAGEHVVAFMRRRAGQSVLVCVPRIVHRLMDSEGFALGDVWEDAQLRLPNGAPERWKNVLTGERLTARTQALAVREIFETFPVAVLLGS